MKTYGQFLEQTPLQPGDTEESPQVIRAREMADKRQRDEEEREAKEEQGKRQRIQDQINRLRAQLAQQQ
jgi:hypothetical protein